MAKKTWVNVSGVWKEVKNVWINVGGTWKQKVIPKGNITGSWKEFMQYELIIYDNGIEHVPIVRGDFVTTPPYNSVFQKNADHIIISGGSENGNRSTLVTDVRVNLTGYKTLNVEISAVRVDDYGDSSRFLMVSPNKTFTQAVAIRTLPLSVSNVKEVLSLDITDLEGEFYLQAQCQSGTSLLLYRMWLS